VLIPPESQTPRDGSPGGARDKSDKLSKQVKHVRHVHPAPVKTRKRRNTFIFLLGSLCGIIIAGLFAEHNDLIEFPEIGDLSMDSLFDVLPAGLVKDMRDFAVGGPMRSRCASTMLPDVVSCVRA
jgi:phospholipid:diacylglycerol acyltransferase